MPRRQATRVYLVRHGETDFNRQQRLQGALDVPLNEAGIAQAGRLADRLAALPIASIISSPLVRASATAAILVGACRCPLHVDPRLREVDHGSWSGLTLPDIGQRFPALVRNEQLTPAAFDVSGGERLWEVQDRVAEALADLLARHEGEGVVVVGHGIALALMCCSATGADITRFPEHLPPNAGVVVLTFLGGQLVEAQTMVDAAIALGSEVPR
jgi:broad specificity phosphatase PhoE